MPLWFSALSPTTRKTHASRHGIVHTETEDEVFYSKDGNTIFCLCSQSPILTNTKTGEIVQEKLLSRMEKQRKAFQKTQPIV